MLEDKPRLPNLDRRWWVFPLMSLPFLAIVARVLWRLANLAAGAGAAMPVHGIVAAGGAILGFGGAAIWLSIYAWRQSTTKICEKGVWQRTLFGEKCIAWAEIHTIDLDGFAAIKLHGQQSQMGIYMFQFKHREDVGRYILAQVQLANSYES